MTLKAKLYGDLPYRTFRPEARHHTRRIGVAVYKVANIAIGQARDARRELAGRLNQLIASRTDGIVAELDRLRTRSSDIEAAAVISIEGLAVATSSGDEVDEERLGAMSAAMLALGERISAELGRGTLDQVLIQGDAGYAVLMPLDENSVLCALAGEEAKLGLVYLDLQRALSAVRALR